MTPWPKLTQREKAVLLQIGKGQTHKIIAAELALSPAAVLLAIDGARRKLGAHTKSHAIVLAQIRNEITPAEFMRHAMETAPSEAEKEGVA